MPRITIVDHPILKRDLSILRSKDTPHGTFRKVISETSTILAYEAMRTIPVEETHVETPIEVTTGYRVVEPVIVVPILRAGLGMIDGFVRFVPEARIGHLGMYRNEETLEPVDYYANLPAGLPTAHIFVVDPMLATGGSAVGALRHLTSKGAVNLNFVCLIAAPEGVKALHDAFPDVPIVTASVDRQLNENAYICPGLGDAGDRTFGTEDDNA